MRICAAQIRPVKGDIAANLDRHKQLIALAAAQQADVVFFPELSLTGYEPELAEGLATDEADTRFHNLQVLSDAHALTIGVGVPLKSDNGTQIGMVIFQPHRPRQTYAKQLLHPDEAPYFVAGTAQAILAVGGQRLAPAICYESLQADHAATAHALGANVYLASVAKSQQGVSKALAHFPGIARTYHMPVLMANCVGYCDNFDSAGHTAIWGKDGALLGHLDSESEGLLLLDTDTAAVSSAQLE